VHDYISDHIRKGICWLLMLLFTIYNSKSTYFTLIMTLIDDRSVKINGFSIASTDMTDLSWLELVNELFLYNL
jgi:hypothetical protein